MHAHSRPQSHPANSAVICQIHSQKVTSISWFYFLVHYAELSCLRLPVHILLTVLFSWNKVAEKCQPDMPSPHLGRNSFIFIPPAVSYKQIGFISLTSLPGSSPLCCQFSLVTQSCSTLCDPMGCSMSGFPVHHQLLELAQSHAHQVGDAIQPSHPLLSPSLAFNVSQHQGLF